MTEANRGVSLVVIVLSVIVVMIMGFFVYQQFFSLGGKESVNFSRTGNLVIDNPGMESGVWYLIYETPGSPANSVKLSFDSKSACRNQVNSCLDLVVGEKVLVKGIKDSDDVLVREMEFLDGSLTENFPAE